ncbi:expressed unknown protein [Seminavis robusta]|uniref:Uncharacterized protein n=1 Tax=Seminavis robusta TaxID=568900 RepID=A0A9N8E775_9STRA|nr:expressed unknown protein [Seminavis robusta]|eukprot:Sro753_g197470.1 n/a (298) ;mRNA; r:44804-45860
MMNRMHSSAASGKAKRFQEQIHTIQQITDRHRRSKELHEKESASIQKHIHELKETRKRLTQEKQQIQLDLAKFNNEETWLNEQCKRLIRQKEEDKKALVESANEWSECELEETKKKREFCHMMKQSTDEHERLLRQMEATRMMSLVCPETVDYLVQEMPTEAIDGGVFTVEIGERLREASNDFLLATEELDKLKTARDSMLKHVGRWQEYALSKGYTEQELEHQEGAWKGTESDGDSHHHDRIDGNPQNNNNDDNLNLFYGTNDGSAGSFPGEAETGGMQGGAQNDVMEFDYEELIE